VLHRPAFGPQIHGDDRKAARLSRSHPNIRQHQADHDGVEVAVTKLADDVAGALRGRPPASRPSSGVASKIRAISGSQAPSQDSTGALARAGSYADTFSEPHALDVDGELLERRGSSGSRSTRRQPSQRLPPSASATRARRSAISPAASRFGLVADRHTLSNIA
jgi:hypothetical protein